MQDPTDSYITHVVHGYVSMRDCRNSVFLLYNQVDDGECYTHHYVCTRQWSQFIVWFLKALFLSGYGASFRIALLSIISMTSVMVPIFTRISVYSDDCSDDYSVVSLSSCYPLLCTVFIPFSFLSFSSLSYIVRFSNWVNNCPLLVWRGRDNSIYKL